MMTLMVPCQLLTAVTDKMARHSDLGPSDGQVIQLIWFLTADIRLAPLPAPQSLRESWRRRGLGNTHHEILHISIVFVRARKLKIYCWTSSKWRFPFIPGCKRSGRLCREGRGQHGRRGQCGRGWSGIPTWRWTCWLEMKQRITQMFRVSWRSPETTFQ